MLVIPYLLHRMSERGLRESLALALAAATIIASSVGGTFSFAGSVAAQGIWGADQAWTKAELFGLFVQTACLPMAYCLLTILVRSIGQSYHISPSCRIISLLSLGCAGAAAGLVAALYMTDGLLECGVLFCSLRTSRSPPLNVNTYWNYSGLCYAIGSWGIACLAFVCTARVFYDSHHVIEKGYALSDISGLGAPLLVEADEESGVESKEYSQDLEDDEIPATTSSLDNGVSTLLIIGLLLPVCLFACMALPDCWAYFTVADVLQYSATRLSQQNGVVWQLALSDRFIIHLFPDILIYYGFLYFVIAGAFVSRAVTCLRHWLQRPACYGTSTFTLGEVVLGAAVLALLGGEAAYWYWGHVFGEVGVYRSSLERAARTTGQLSNVLLGLLFFPIVRNGLWARAWGLSWEATLRAHRWLGRAFLLSLLLHLALWLASWGHARQLHVQLLNMVGACQPGFDDYTVPMAFYVTLLAMVFLGLLSREVVRRKQWKLFRLAHNFAYVLVFCALWHAASLWYYIISGLALHALDIACRMWMQTAAPRTALVLTRGCFNVIHIRGLVAEPGQYVFINIAALSMSEWHPFTVMCNASTTATLVIKSMKDGTWTDRLRHIKDVANSGGITLPVSIEGPYGAPWAPTGREHVVFIAGGVGITPIMAALQNLKDSQWLEDTAPVLQLVWALRDKELFELLLPRIQSFSRHSPRGLQLEIYSTAADWTNAQEVTSFHHGRPDLTTLIQGV